MGYLITKISDSGIGIKKEQGSNLFSTFNSGLGASPEQRALKNNGIGVGLTTALNLANALGGEVLVRSNPDWGTEVYFSVQLRDYEGEVE